MTRLACSCAGNESRANSQLGISCYLACDWTLIFIVSGILSLRVHLFSGHVKFDRCFVVLIPVWILVYKLGSMLPRDKCYTIINLLLKMLCSNCSNYQDSLKVWMGHLASCHPLPVEWLSDKAKLLTDDENQRPYTVVTDSRKRRRRPTTPRPLNTFMIFSRHIRRNILSVFPDASNSQLSKELGILWKKIAGDIKSMYEEEAKRLAQLHALEFPDYKYQPKKRVRRFGRAMFERQQCVTERSNSTSGTDEETVKDNNSVQGSRRSSDIENQYIRYSILGKNIVKRECQSFISPIKAEAVEKVEPQEHHYSQPIPKPLNVRITNFNENSVFLRQQRIPSNNTMYLLPSENLVISSATTLTSQELENVNLDDEIDITGNIFSNDLDLDWPEIEETY